MFIIYTGRLLSQHNVYIKNSNQQTQNKLYPSKIIIYYEEMLYYLIMRKRNFLFIGIIALLIGLLFVLDFKNITPPYTDTIESFEYNGLTIPKYDGNMSRIINNNIPLFTDDEILYATNNTYEYYGSLDELGRCTYAMASLNKSLQPKNKRGSIKDIHPTGWNQVYYDFLDGDGHIYERSHLLAYMFTGVDNENEKKEYAERNLITGTQYFNSGPDEESGMVVYENLVYDYMCEHPNTNVLYRVTPIFQGNNLLASGVLMEAKSLMNNDIQFCVFIYNAQPNIQIDYATGKTLPLYSDFINFFISLFRY